VVARSRRKNHRALSPPTSNGPKINSITNSITTT
jgi:hypothetical protein